MVPAKTFRFLKKKYIIILMVLFGLMVANYTYVYQPHQKKSTNVHETSSVSLPNNISRIATTSIPYPTDALARINTPIKVVYYNNILTGYLETVYNNK